MRNISLTLVLLIYNLVVFSQANQPSETVSAADKPIEISNSNGMAQFQKVIQVDTASITSLYKSVNRWVILTYNSPNDVIKVTLPDEEVRGQGYASGVLQLSVLMSGDMRYMFSIEIKPGRVRFTVYSMECIFPNARYAIETYVLKSDGTFRTNGQATKIIEGATKVSNGLFNSLENALLSKSKKKDDW